MDKVSLLPADIYTVVSKTILNLEDRDNLIMLYEPIMGPLAYQLGFSVETNIMILVAANGLVNLITPTCGAIMGGLALARVDYSTWFKWSIKVVLTIALASMVILTLAMVAL